MRKLAVITGADGGMGREITYAVAAQGIPVIMACYRKEKGEKKREEIVARCGNRKIEVMELDLSSLASVNAFAEKLLQRNEPIELLMNNAGVLDPKPITTVDGLSHIVSVNYVGPYLLTRKLLPLMIEGGRIVNMISCTYAIGKIHLPDFFTHGRKGKGFWRIPIYSNSKLALTLFTLELAERVKSRGITVNAADPGIVSTDIIRMYNPIIDTLCDLFFRPIIRTPKQGARNAIELLISKEAAQYSGTLHAGECGKPFSQKFIDHPMRRILWEETEKIVTPYLEPKPLKK
ncbi:MAG: SDR family NAD(P)-dependent oxidoreductase [Porphyromonadaceae bacterium]|nr:SDR family NAD(P)-dependent oxidoreductase [Porphyromonadaceae bacterium]